MATAPVKSQPLHNFPLSFLKWGGTSTSKNNHPSSNHHHRRFRRPTSSSSDLLPPSSPDHPSEPDSDPPRHGSRTSRNNRFAVRHSPKQISNNDETDEEVADNKKRGGDTEDAAVEAEETVQKPWNLRPRRQPAVPVIAIGAKNANGEVQEPVHSVRVRGDTSMMMVQCGERKKEMKKNKFWIALSKEEIEEDIFVMTGSRPNRRPKKRPKNVQKQMDSVFPGLWLVGVSADAYKVEETLSKASLHGWGAE
ncbi:PREDICTED: uncharacterized protein LOC109349637 isoform X1 [Lupinus angustifolius]|uniref:uncharacterized protein LOC109349637 isoform X1 n=1 Tax=Lupinus angustifolius TaxID=3871 RepID=UPI00092F2D52|nr:PREDICTED: uncharacterized protein LOC109349637 isoform X1 [Lupinus angustifolius]XP_019446062.1 PREDICTED: uncharacterized protein LOC109349637 isoform X1 [Lupinus angustifolius]